MSDISEIAFADPSRSTALFELMYAGKAKLTEQEQRTYDLWKLWKFHNTKPWEVDPSINREEISKAFLKMEEYYEDRKRMDEEKIRKKYRNMGGGYYSEFRTRPSTFDMMRKIVRRLEDEDESFRRRHEELL